MWIRSKPGLLLDRRHRGAVADVGGRLIDLDEREAQLLEALSTRWIFHSDVASVNETTRLLHEGVLERREAELERDSDDDSEHTLVYSEAELYEAAFGYRDYSTEWSFLESLWHAFGWDVTSPHMVDIAAGSAGHALAAAQAGWISYALDRSVAMAELGRRRALEMGVTLEYSKQDMETFSIPVRCHLAITMLDSISYITSNDDFLSHLSAVRDSLFPGGLYVIETDHPSAVFGFERTTKSTWTADYQGKELRVEWVAEAGSFDPVTQCSLVSASFELWSRGEREQVIRETAWQRAFTFQEFDALAKASGTFEIIGVFGGFDLDLGLADDRAWRTVVAMRRTA